MADKKIIDLPLESAMTTPDAQKLIFLGDPSNGKLYKGLKSIGIAISTKTNNYTLVLADSNSLISMNVASANTLNVPPNSSVAFPIGTQILVLQFGTGQTNIAPGAGATLVAADGYLKLRVQWSMAVVIKIATDTWVVSGDLAS